MCQSDILMGTIAHLKSWYAIIIVMVPNVWCKFFPQTFSYCSHFLFLIHIWLQFCDRKFPFCDTSSCFEIMDHYSVPGANYCWLFLISDCGLQIFRSLIFAETGSKSQKQRRPSPALLKRQFRGHRAKLGLVASHSCCWWQWWWLTTW